MTELAVALSLGGIAIGVLGVITGYRFPQAHRSAILDETANELRDKFAARLAVALVVFGALLQFVALLITLGDDDALHPLRL
jgi:hypothetical protein